MARVARILLSDRVARSAGPAIRRPPDHNRAPLRQKAISTSAFQGYAFVGQGPGFGSRSSIVADWPPRRSPRARGRFQHCDMSPFHGFRAARYRQTGAYRLILISAAFLPTRVGSSARDGEVDVGGFGAGGPRGPRNPYGSGERVPRAAPAAMPGEMPIADKRLHVILDRVAAGAGQLRRFRNGDPSAFTDQFDNPHGQRR